MSIETSYSTTYNELKKRAGFFRKMISNTKLKEMARIETQIENEEFRRLFSDNPNVIFVVGAGNDSKNVEEIAETHLSAVGSPNVVNVAATDFNGKIAFFSNKSKQEIEIAAPGVTIPSALLGGGQIRLSGTSMATPLVTNRLTQILQERPELSATDAIQVLFDSHTIPIKDLESVVNSGRFLLPGGLVGVPTPVVQAILKELNEELYLNSNSCRKHLESSQRI